MGTDQTIGEIGGRVLPDEKRFLDGRFIFEANIVRIEQTRDGLTSYHLGEDHIEWLWRFSGQVQAMAAGDWQQSRP